MKRGWREKEVMSERDGLKKMLCENRGGGEDRWEEGER